MLILPQALMHVKADQEGGGSGITTSGGENITPESRRRVVPGVDALILEVCDDLLRQLRAWNEGDCLQPSDHL